MTDELNFSGTRVLVTGGSGDIGRAMCLAFAARGAKVAFTWFLGHERCDQLVDAITAAGGVAAPIRANLRDKGAAATIAAALPEAWGGLDVLISNAATGVLKPAMQLTAKHWKAVMAVNAQSFLELAQAFAPKMAAGGRILALTSAGASRAIENYALVGASKAALESLVRHLAMELGPKAITVNAICPGVVDTAALDHFPNREQLLRVARMRTPNGRLATPEDVAQVALLLASPFAAMIQGQTITVDGGYGILA
ncbi:MAG: SDR family oxidoreductase [Myxococcota bacterium]